MCFIEALGLTEMGLKTIKQKIKTQEERGVARFRDGTPCDESTVESVKDIASDNNSILSRDQVSMLTIRKSVPAFMAIAWFKRYFKLVGDQMPNTLDEIHLEACDYQDLYEEYVFDMTHVNKIGRNEEYLSYTRWRELWIQHFPNVRVREYKQVTGKCSECEMLSDTRKRTKTAWGRQLVTECHAFHR